MNNIKKMINKLTVKSAYILGKVVGYFKESAAEIKIQNNLHKIKSKKVKIKTEIP